KERQKQIFGMVWLIKTCESAPTAVVPRNRIYARYVTICADNAVKPLSPASFGKLVRIIFPNITTRRLGVRGQSKYHYCGIRLMNVHSNGSLGSFGSMSSISNATTPIFSGASSCYNNSVPASPTGFNLASQSQNTTPLTYNKDGSIDIFNELSHENLNDDFSNELNLNDSGFDYIGVNHQELKLKFSSSLLQGLIDNTNIVNFNTPLVLPSLYPYLPKNVDYDIADTLYSLYRTHCTAMFESLRYMQLKKLYGLLSSFHGSLTAPVFKLYISEPIVSWVEQCDIIMYKNIIRMLARLVLQNIPEDILDQLRLMTGAYPDKLLTTIHNLPYKFIIKKLVPAKKFCFLISRLIRASETAKSASKILMNQEDRNSMLDNWSNLVNYKQIVESELPCGELNINRCIEVLKVEIPKLLTFTEDDKNKMKEENDRNSSNQPETSNCERNGKIPPRLFLLCMSTIVTSCLKDISLAGGTGFGAWWVVRCWIDEWMRWYSELSGFLL
ncbi:RFX family transcription factor ASCRUDRAFT_25856, partial [Ascoidea rubescens DSM 1968]